MTRNVGTQLHPAPAGLTPGRRGTVPGLAIRRNPVLAGLLFVALVMSAGALALALAWPELGWLAWISLLPLFLAIRVLAPPPAGMAGALWGGCLYACLVAGPAPAIHPALASLTLLVAVPALYLYLGSLLTRRIGFSPLILALGWIGVEFALLSLGLRSGLLAGTQADGPIVEWVGRLLGYVFVALMVACANASLLAVLTHVRVSSPSETLLAMLRQTGTCPSSHTPWSHHRLALTHAHPRAPPRHFLIAVRGCAGAGPPPYIATQ